MKGFIGNIEALTKQNDNFRKVLYTGKNSQLVLMSLAPGEEIGAEVHTLDQFLRIESGDGIAVLDGIEHHIANDSVIVVPAGANHNVINKGSVPMKIYTIYSPAEHKDGTIHKTKADAMADTADHFDGKTTE